MKKYISNLLFTFLNTGRKVDIARDFVSGRGFYGVVHGFNYKTGKIIVLVFDYGMNFPREYEKEQLIKS